MTRSSSAAREVVLDALRRTAEEARQAAGEEPDSFAALARHMHRVIDVRAPAVIPALLGQIPSDDEEIARARQAELDGPALTLADLREFPPPQTQTPGPPATSPDWNPAGQHGYHQPGGSERAGG